MRLKNKAVVSYTDSAGKLNLTDREKEVLMWAGRGKTLPETAGIIGSAPAAAATCVKSVIEKLDGGNKNRVVAKAIYINIINI